MELLKPLEGFLEGLEGSGLQPQQHVRLLRAHLESMLALSSSFSTLDCSLEPDVFKRLIEQFQAALHQRQSKAGRHKAETELGAQDSPASGSASAYLAPAALLSYLLAHKSKQPKWSPEERRKFLLDYVEGVILPLLSLFSSDSHGTSASSTTASDLLAWATGGLEREETTAFSLSLVKTAIDLVGQAAKSNEREEERVDDPIKGQSSPSPLVLLDLVVSLKRRDKDETLLSDRLTEVRHSVLNGVRSVVRSRRKQLLQELLQQDLLEVLLRDQSAVIELWTDLKCTYSFPDLSLPSSPALTLSWSELKAKLTSGGTLVQDIKNAGPEVFSLLRLLFLSHRTSLRVDPDFWQAIKAGLSSSDPLVRKIAFDMLSTATAAKGDLASEGTGGGKNEEKRIEARDRRRRWWESFVLVFDFFERELQPHLVNQVWPSFDRLWAELSEFIVEEEKAKSPATMVACGLPIPNATWLSVLLERGFYHEANVVRRFIVHSIFTYGSKRMEDLLNRISSSPPTPALPLLPSLFVLGPLLHSVNTNTAIWYYGDMDMRTPFISFFRAYFLCLTPDKREEFLQLLPLALCQSHYGSNGGGCPEALAAQLEFLAECEPTPAFNGETVEVFRWMLGAHVLPSYTKRYKEAIIKNILVALQKHTNAIELVEFVRLLEILPVWALAWGTPTYEAINAWLMQYFRQEEGGRAKKTRKGKKPALSLADTLKREVQQICRGSSLQLSVSAIALLFLFLEPAELFEVFDPALTELDKGNSHTYVKESVYKSLASLCNSVLGLLETSSPKPETATLLNQMFSQRCTSLVLYLQPRLSRLRVLQNMEQHDLEDIDLLMQLTGRFFWACAGMPLVETFFQAIMMDLSMTFSGPQDSSLEDQVRRALCCEAVAKIVSSNSARLDMWTRNDWVKVLTKPLLPRSRGGAGKWSKVLSRMEENRWKIVEFLLAPKPRKRKNRPVELWMAADPSLVAEINRQAPEPPAADLPQKQFDLVYSAVLEGLEVATGSPEAIVPLFNVCGTLLPKLIGPADHIDGDEEAAGPTAKEEEERERIEGIFQRLWTAYQDSAKKPRKLTEALVRCVFQPALMRKKSLNESETAPVKAFFLRLLAWGRPLHPLVIRSLALRVCEVWRAEPLAAIYYVKEILELCTYREEPQRGDLLSNDEVDLEESAGVEPARTWVRVIVTTFLDTLPLRHSGYDGKVLYYQPNSPPEAALQARLQDFIDTLVLLILKQNSSAAMSKVPMVNSALFGLKLRSLQTLCVISKYIKEATVDEVNATLWALLAQTHLPVTRYYVELVCIQMCLRFPARTIRPHLLPVMQNLRTRGQVAASVLIVGAYVLRTMDKEEKDYKEYRNELVKSVLPWLGSSTGVARVIAQLVLTEKLPECVAEDVGKGTLDAEYLRSTCDFLRNNRDIYKLIEKQRKMFDELEPAKGCSLEALLSSPVNGVNEFTPQPLVEMMKEAMVDRFNAANEAGEIECGLAEVYFKKLRLGEEDDLKRAAEGSNERQDIQRKIDPTAVLDRLMDSSVGLLEREQLEAKPKQDLIVVASLVDKIPNLAGLARTCEIFGAQKLIVGNLKLRDEPLFSQISVTAEKWVQMEEVKEDELARYLRKCRSDGYKVIGVEQTANSQSLENFNFPSKAVLVLGKEKEGIPVHLLGLLDCCVEIPQLGIIRSLNVHVSGAILIWEYTRQRLRAGSSR